MLRSSMINARSTRRVLLRNTKGAACSTFWVARIDHAKHGQCSFEWHLGPEGPQNAIQRIRKIEHLIPLLARELNSKLGSEAAQFMESATKLLLGAEGPVAAIGLPTECGFDSR